MPKKKTSQEEKQGSVLIKAATTIGRAAGKIAALVSSPKRPSKKATAAPTKPKAAPIKKAQVKKTTKPKKRAVKPAARKRN